MTREPSIRWRAGMGQGKSAALQHRLVERMNAGARPVAYVSAMTDVGLRLERVETGSHPAALALDLGPLQGRPVRHLSSGERQRLRLALALTPGVQVIALDEPMRHLDPSYQQALALVLEESQSAGAQLLACDLRQRLPESLFDQQLGEPRPLPPAATMPRSAPGAPLTLSIPRPFLPGSKRQGALSLSVAEGELVTVQGPNGSGKSSLLGALREAGRGQKKSVSLARQDLEVHIFAPTVRQELMDVLGLLPRLPGWLAHILESEASPPDCLEPLANLLGLGPFLDTPMAKLPLGGLALLGTAVALGLGQDLVLLDEPSQGLDQSGARTLGTVLSRCAGAGARLVVATHDPELLVQGDHAWQLDRGQVQGKGLS